LHRRCLFSFSEPPPFFPSAEKHGLAADVLKHEGTKGGRNVAEQMSDLVVYTEAVKFKV
jgi:hypothetical protein